MEYALKDMKANNAYYLIFTFSLIILSFVLSLSITSFIDYYETNLGALVGNSRYIYEAELRGATNDDLKLISKLSQEEFGDINIITDVSVSSIDNNPMSKIYVLNYKGWNNKVVEGDRLDNDSYNIVVNNSNYEIDDIIKINSNNYKVIGKLDDSKFNMDNYIYIPYDPERDMISKEIVLKEGIVTLLICSDKKINYEIDLLKDKLTYYNDNLNVNIVNKKLEFIKDSIQPNTYFISRVTYSLLLVLISFLNLILFISYWNKSKKKEIYIKKILGASDFNIIMDELIKLSICVIISSAIALIIQYILDINLIRTDEIPTYITNINIILVPVISVILVIGIIFFNYPYSNKKNVSSILKE